MKLREARKLAIKYCEDNCCSYTYVSYNNAVEFYVTNEEDKHTVFLVNRSGSMDAYMSTRYAVDFHKGFKKKNCKRNDGKRKTADMCNRECVEAPG